MGVDAVDVINEAYAAADPAAFRVRVLVRLAAAIGADSAIFLRSVNGALVGPHGFLNKERYVHLPTSFAARPRRHQSFQTKQRIAMASGRGVYVDTDVFGPGERERLPFYAEIIRPQGIRSQLVAGLRLHDRQVGLIYLCRHGAGTGYRDGDAEQLRALVPALAIAQAAFEATHEAPSTDALAPLTARQRQIAAHVAAGLSNAEIALVLGCSPNTVRNHLAAIFETLGARSRTEVALLARGVSPGPTAV